TRSKRDWSSDVCSSDLTKQKQTEGERLSNFIIDPLFVMEGSDKRVKYILKFVSNVYSKVVEVDGEALAINSSFKKFCMSYGMFKDRKSTRLNSSHVSIS